MKALKRKWDQGYKKTFEIVKKMQKLNKKIKKLPMEEIDYNQLDQTTISFEKIPLLKLNYSKLEEDLTAETSFLSKGESRNIVRNNSTNTGPDMILMLNGLKKSQLGSELRELYEMNKSKDSDESILHEKFNTFSPNSAYKSIKKKNSKRKVSRSGYSISEVIETQSHNPYESLPFKL